MNPKDKEVYLAHGIDPNLPQTDRIWEMGFMYGTRLSEEQRLELKEWVAQQRVEGNTRAVRQLRDRAERALLDILARELDARASSKSAAE